MNRLMKWAKIGVVALSLSLVGAGVARAQTELPICAFDDGTPGSCVLVQLAPETLVGEMWVNDQQIVFDTPKINTVYDIEPAAGITGKFEYRAIEDSTDPNFNLLYVYPDVSRTITTPPLGQWGQYTLTPVKKYIRQAVELTCSVKNWVDEDVACGVNIDGMDQTDPILAGQTAVYALDPGSHTISLTLTGDPTQTILWSPAGVTKKIYTYASSYVSRQVFTFSKAGHLIAAMDQPGALADWYVDGELVGTQVAGIDGWVNPFKSHKVEIKAINDATQDGFAAFTFHWKDATQWPYVGTGQTRMLTFKLYKEGNWAQPFEYVVPKGSLVEGPHSYTLTYACADDPANTFTSTVAFTVDPLAALVYPELYLRFSGVERNKLSIGDIVDPVNAQQALKALVTLSNRDRTAAQGIAANCAASITLDGALIPLTPGLIYQIRP